MLEEVTLNTAGIRNEFQEGPCSVSAESAETAASPKLPRAGDVAGSRVAGPTGRHRAGWLPPMLTLACCSCAGAARVAGTLCERMGIPLLTRGRWW